MEHNEAFNVHATFVSGVRFRLLMIVALAAVLAGGAWNIASADEPCVPHWDNTIGQPGMNERVYALAVFDDGSGARGPRGCGPALFAGGRFTTAGGVSANYIARWDGESWSALGSGMNGAVRALTVFDDGTGPALYAGGEFTTAGGASANYIARWDGESWSTLGNGMNSPVYALTVFDDGSASRGPRGSGSALYAGGAFTMAGEVSANYIARWDGESWSPLGSGMGGGDGFVSSVYALTVFDDGSGPPGSGPALYAGGQFTTAGAVEVNYIARWDGESWSALGSGMGGGGVSALTVFDDDSGPLGPPGSSTALYAGGWFATAGGEEANYIARWDGQSWASLGSGMSGWVIDLTMFDDGSGAGGLRQSNPALYAGGIFTTAGGVAVSRIAKWDGQSWSALGSGMNHSVYALTVFDDGSGSGPALYAGGVFTTAGGVTANRIAKWQGCPTEPDCGPADLNCDGVVNVADLLLLFDAWGSCDDCDDCPADLNGDCVVNVADLLIMFDNWG